MEVFYSNSSLLNISHRPDNQTFDEMTVYQMCQSMPAALIVYICQQVTNLFLGAPANIMVMWLIHKSKKDSSTSDIFLLQLAIIDVLFCLIPPLEIANVFFITSNTTWYVLRVFYAMKDSSPLFLSCICLDRYMAVWHPIVFTNLKDRQHRNVLALLVWLFIVGYSAAKSADDKHSFVNVMTSVILGSFVFLVLCNVSILWALMRSGPGKDEMHPVKKRAFKMVLVILCIIIFHYLPPLALFPFYQYFHPDVFHCYVQYSAFALMDFSSTVQPLLYLSNKEKLPWSCCQSRDKQNQ